MIKPISASRRSDASVLRELYKSEGTSNNINASMDATPVVQTTDRQSLMQRDWQALEQRRGDAGDTITADASVQIPQNNMQVSSEMPGRDAGNLNSVYRAPSTPTFSSIPLNQHSWVRMHYPLISYFPKALDLPQDIKAEEKNSISNTQQHTRYHFNYHNSALREMNVESLGEAAASIWSSSRPSLVHDDESDREVTLDQQATGMSSDLSE